MNNYEKLTRDQFWTFLNTTPKGESETWTKFGHGITDLSIDYNPQIETEKYINNKNATSSHESNQKQSNDITHRCFKNEPIFEYMNSLRDKVGDATKSQVLEVDTWNGTEKEGVMTYPAKKTDVITPVTSFLGENAEIGYSIYFNGDPEEGTVTITDGKPTFTPTATVE
jgi:hypothetical protein